LHGNAKLFGARPGGEAPFFEGAIETESFGVRRAHAVIGAIPFSRRIEDLGSAPNDIAVSFGNGRSGGGVVGLGVKTGSD